MVPNVLVVNPELPAKTVAELVALLKAFPDVPTVAETVPGYAGRGMIGCASGGAVAACILVLIVGFAVHKPLSTVPENSLKFAVGVLLAHSEFFGRARGSARNGREPT